MSASDFSISGPFLILDHSISLELLEAESHAFVAVVFYLDEVGVDDIRSEEEGDESINVDGFGDDFEAPGMRVGVC